MQKIYRVLLFIGLISFIGCRKENNVFDGPSINETYSTFKVIDPFKVSKNTVDFNAGESVYFSASFNKVVTWQIDIVGSTSKAHKIIEGSGKTINISNATWNGSTTIFPIFAAENCDAKLTIKDIADTFLVNVQITQAKKIEGLMIADFETGLNSSWTKFIQSGADMDFKVKTDSVAPQGLKYLNMAGTVNWDYLIGLIDYPALAYGTNPTFNLPSNPDDVYFNCLIYGVPNTNQSIVLFQFKEDENGDGTFNANTEDEYDLEVKVDWSGWKLVSIKYAEITTIVNGAPATPKGNGLHNPDKIGKISMLHLANPNDGFASTKIDYIIFTNSKPLEP
jgi:hypothetical protein